MRALRLAVLTTVLCSGLAASQSAPAATHVARLVRITSTPALTPSYSPSIHDYVVRCNPATPVRFSAWAAAGTTAMIDGRSASSTAVRLEAGQAATIEGRAAAGETDYHVRCLPQDFPQWTEATVGSSGIWTIATPTLSLGTARSHYIVVFDEHGVPVWWYKARRVPIDAKLLPQPGGQSPAIAFSSFPASSEEYQVRRLDGTFVRRIVSPDGQIDDHELQVDSNGDYAFLVYAPKSGVDLTPFGGPADATVLQGEIEEVNPAGKLVWSWSTDGHVSMSESARWVKTILSMPVPLAGGVQGYDFFHANAVSLGRSIVLLSLRQTDGVYAIDRATGQILWKLGGTPTPESLTVVGDPADATDPLGGQHDARLLPDGTVTVFDDGTLLGRAPRALHFRIDPVARTATLIGEVSDPTVTSSFCCGSARLLASGNWLVSWGGDPVVGEYRPDGTPVWRLSFDGLFSYRIVPVALGELSADELRAGMDAMASR